MRLFFFHRYKYVERLLPAAITESNLHWLHRQTEDRKMCHGVSGRQLVKIILGAKRVWQVRWLHNIVNEKVLHGFGLRSTAQHSMPFLICTGRPKKKVFSQILNLNNFRCINAVIYCKLKILNKYRLIRDYLFRLIVNVDFFFFILFYYNLLFLFYIIMNLDYFMPPF